MAAGVAALPAWRKPAEQDDFVTKKICVADTLWAGLQPGAWPVACGAGARGQAEQQTLLPIEDHPLQPVQDAGEGEQNQGVQNRHGDAGCGLLVGHRAHRGRDGGDKRGQGLRVP